MELIPLGYKTSAIIYIMRTLTKQDEQLCEDDQKYQSEDQKECSRKQPPNDIREIDCQD